MADETTTTAADLMRQYRDRLAYQVVHQSLFLSNLKKDMSTKRWDGSFVEIPVIFNAFLQGAQAITETGTVGTGQVEDTGKAKVQTGIIEFTVSLSTQLMKQLKMSGNQDDDPRGAVDAVKLKMQRATDALTAFANEAAIGAGTGLLAAVTAANASSTTVTVGTTANFFFLYPGRIVDIRNRTTGAVTSAGRKIISVNRTAGTITVDTAITTATTDGLFILNTGTGANAPPQGLDQVFTGGVFQNIDSAVHSSWQGQVYGGAARDPLKSEFDKCERGQVIACGQVPKWYVADPAVADKYGDLYMDRLRWQSPTAKLDTGFEGYSYKGKAILSMFEAPASTVYGVFPDDIKIYTLDDGPNWDDLTGAMWQRFSSTLPVQAWLVWFYQMGFSRLAAQAKITGLNQQT